MQGNRVNSRLRNAIGLIPEAQTFVVVTEFPSESIPALLHNGTPYRESSQTLRILRSRRLSFRSYSIRRSEPVNSESMNSPSNHRSRGSALGFASRHSSFPRDFRRRASVHSPVREFLLGFRGSFIWKPIVGTHRTRERSRTYKGINNVKP